MWRMQRCGVVLSVVLCAAWLNGAVAKSPSDIDEVDASVSSAIARTMASIEGRNLITDLPSERPHRRGPPLGLSKVSNREASVAMGHRRLRVKKQMVISKADVPKRLSGYLGWGNSKAATSVKESSFSTHWKTTGSKKAESGSVYLRDLENGRVEQEAPKEEAPKKDQSLFASATASTAYSKMMEEQSIADDFPSMNWGEQKKTTQIAKVEESHNTGNKYLNSIGWNEPEKVVSSKDNPYLVNLSDDPQKKKILAAAEMAEKSAKNNKYLDQLMPSAAYEISLQ